MANPLPFESTDPDATETRLALERLRVALLASAFRRAFISTLVASACVGYLAHRGAPAPYVIGWLLLAMGTIALRRTYAVRRLQDPSIAPERALRGFTALSGLVGLVHGVVALVFLPNIDPREQAVVTMVVLCWCAGSLIVGSIAPRVYYAFVTLAAAPFALFWLLYGGDGGWVIASLIALMFAMVGLFARDAERVLLESFNLRHQNEALLHRLELATARRATFIEFLNHDLRNALGVVGTGLATLSLRSNAAAADERSVLDGATQGLEWARGLIDALDELAQLDAGAVAVRPERVVLADCASTLEQTFHAVARDKGIRLSTLAPDVAVLVDRRLLNRILQNLVDNAIKYTRTGAIDVRGRYDAGQLVWEIEDTGPGIPKAERERVFDEFYQLDNPERSRAKGRGLGLSVVRRFVALMGGTVMVEDGESGGARFVVRIPGEPAPGPVSSARGTTEPVRAQRRAMVWILEDQAEARAGLVALLEELGYAVRAFEADDTLIHALAAERPDAVMCDLRLPSGRSGLDIARELQRRIIDLPIAIITGEGASDRLEQLRASGFMVLRKPLDVPALSRWLVESV